MPLQVGPRVRRWGLQAARRLRLRARFGRRFVQPGLKRILELEAALGHRPQAVQASPLAPERFDMLSQARLGQLPVVMPEGLPALVGALRGLERSLAEVRLDPREPRRQVDKATLAWLEQRARRLGVTCLGYTRVLPEQLLRGQAVAYPQAVVLGLEMDREAVSRAPHKQTNLMVMETYWRMGRVVNRLADELRARGFGVQAGHPLLGQALYPRLAVSAGLGWPGDHGLLITPAHGPRVRLAALYVSMENLPFGDPSAHAWVGSFCKLCRACIRQCPVQAIYPEGRLGPEGQRKHLEPEACVAYFQKHFGCTICVKVCPFAKRSYLELKTRYERHLARRGDDRPGLDV